MSKDRDNSNSARAASTRYMDLIRSTVQERSQTDALYKLCNAIKGRQETANLRRSLHGLADSNLKQPKGFTSNPRSELQKATSRLKANRTGEVAIGSQLKEQSNLLNQANRELQVLRSDLGQKRRVALLLETLSHKEDIRLQRFSEIRVLIDELRKSATNVYAQELPSVPKEPLDLVATSVVGSSYVQDTLATLHAHRIRTLRLSRQTLPSDPIPSLRTAIAKRLSLGEDDPNVQKMVDQLVARAKRKAKIQSSYHSVLPPHTPESDVDVDELSSTVVHAFSTETLPVISNTLDQSRQLVGGETYIGVLKGAVLSSKRPPPDGRHDTVALAEACHPNSTTSSNTVDRMKRTVAQCQQYAHFIESTLRPPEEHAELPELIAQHEESTSKADKYASALLERKAKKVEQAERLVRDVQRYIKDGKLLAGIE
ncbi:hypothetical protein EYR40_010881 [Pleurotus pulmonarius]|nr:hypothetical protein EYR36_002648 [Pleurotus pulmonarius]KAF4586864.1 hypothetical protein EYR40_010881 [Pleurotus pulmonarius]